MQKNSEHAGTLLPLHELQCEHSENQEQAEKPPQKTHKTKSVMMSCKVISRHQQSVTYWQHI